MSKSKLQTSIATHYRRYALGSVLTLAAGFISFPITTRLLTTEQFGVLGYWEAWILLLAALLKLGAGDTMMRFYPSGGDKTNLVRHATNFVLAPTLIGVSGWLFSLLLVVLCSAFGYIDSPALAVAAVSVVMLNVINSHVLWMMRTREMSGAGTLVEVAWRWLGVAATVVTLLYVVQSVIGLFVARIVIAGIIATFLIGWALCNMQFSLKAFDWPYAKEGLAYGLPLALKEFSGVVLGFIDRIMLKWILNDYALVGIFTIGFTLANYVDLLVNAALGQAWTPAANRIYNTQGPEAVRVAKQRLMQPLVYVCVGLATAVFLGGRDFVILIAGEGKVDAAPIFVAATVFLMITPVLNIAGTGLLLERRSKTLFVLTLVAAVFNILANLLTIPSFGIMGATLTTCGSQLLFHVLVYRYCSRELKCLPDAAVVMKSLAAAALCIGIEQFTNELAFQLPVWRLCVLAFVMVFGYVLPAMIMDRQLRNILLGRESLRL